MDHALPGLCLVLLSAFLLVSSTHADDLKFQSVDRKINLQTQHAKVSEAIKLKNTGSTTVSSFYLCYVSKNQPNLAYIKVSEGSEKAELKVSPATVPDAPAGVSCFSATFSKGLAAGDVIAVDVYSVYTDTMTPYPAEISQQGKQLVLYTENVYVVSPYAVSQQTTEVLLASKQVESYTDESPTHKSDNKVKYGRYDSVKPFQLKEMRLHFENNKPFIKVLKLTKEIEVSHWGNVYVEEIYELKNNGAKHTGAFSRLKFAHQQNGKANSFQELKARLPAKANALYYKDLIGNISSSNVRKTTTETVIDFELRYPLMGGWKVDFFLGYSLPLQGFLFRLPSGKRRFSIDFSSSLGDVWVDDLEVKVVLPEGSTAIEATLPFDVEQQFDAKFTYLDITGRPVVVLRKRNVVGEHNVKLNVDYSFSALSQLREPAVLVTAFAAFFALVMVWNRCEFTISKDENWKKAQIREKFETVMQKLSDMMAGYVDGLLKLDHISNGLRDSSEVPVATAAKVKVEAQLAEMEKEVATLAAPVSDSSSRIAAELSAMVAKAVDLKGKYAQQFKSKAELVSKNTAPQEISKKLAPSAKQLADAHKELEAEIDKVVGGY